MVDKVKMLQPHQTQYGHCVERRRHVPLYAAATAAAAACAIFANCVTAFSPSATTYFVAPVGRCTFSIPSARRSPSQSKHICIFVQQQEDHAPDSQKSSPQTCVIERLDLREQFNRWRLLQQLLEAEADATDVNEVLYRVMNSFLEVPRPRKIKDAKGITRSNTSPLINDDKKKMIQSLLNFADVDAECENDSGIPLFVPVFADGCIAGSGSHVLEAVEKLLPDPNEEEDAHKTCWDIVMEMYGKEAVKNEEMERSEEWRARCAVARVLLHYDFLETGIIEDGNVFSTAE